MATLQLTIQYAKNFLSGNYVENKDKPSQPEWKNLTINSDNQENGQMETTNGVAYTIALKHLSFHKQVYAPCEIKVMLSLGFKRNAPTRTALQKALKNAAVSLSAGGNSIAKNYYVQEVVASYFKSGTSVRLELNIFSRDKKLSIDKYCKAYTRKKLYEDICKDNPLVTDAGIEWANNLKLSFLHYKRTVGEKGKTTDKTCEYIQPYLVQYNESFYDFLARTANRCGEFLYFEDGKFHLGLREPTTTHSIISYESVTYSDLAEGIVTVNDSYHNGVNHNSYSTYTASNYVYKTDVPLDDYITIFREDGFAKYLNLWLGRDPEKLWASQIFNLLYVLFQKDSYGSMVIGLLIDWGMTTYTVASLTTDLNKKGNEDYIFKMTDEQKRQIQAGKKEVTEASPFSSLIPNSEVQYKFKENLNSLFYEVVKIAEESVSRNAVRVNLGHDYQHLKIGDRVIIDGNDAEPYVVIEVEGDISTDNQTISANYSVVMLPVYTYQARKDDAEKTNLEFTCPPLMPAPTRQSAPQLAFIAENKDPELLGRVRIRYPWQKETDDSSPWIRMATPFATEGGGIYFCPAVGDEVLVDYDGGNIEHPYVVGALYTGKSNHPGYDRIISSSTGHCIKMKDKNYEYGYKDKNFKHDFISGVLGLFQFLTTPFPNLEKALDCLSDVSGGMEITDRFGLYNIKMDSAARAVTIQSPLGNVTVNAFTGISLSAPNGKITIQGKDVEITALNTLSITSGVNDADAYTEIDQLGKNPGTLEKIKTGIKGAVKPKQLGKTLADSVADDFIVDVRVIRCVLDALLKPAAGTMTLKSWRFLRLEAGRGEARIPARGYSPSGYTHALSQENQTAINLFNKIKKGDVVLAWLKEMRFKYMDVQRAIANFKAKAAGELLVNDVAWDVDTDTKELIGDAISNPQSKGFSFYTSKSKKVEVKASTVDPNLSESEKKKKEKENKKIDKQRMTELEEAAIAVQKAIATYKKEYDSPGEKALKGFNITIFPKVEDKNSFDRECPSLEDVVRSREIVKLRRKTLFQILNQLTVDVESEETGNNGATVKIVMTDADVEDNDKWANYVDHLKLKPKHDVSIIKKTGRYIYDLGASFLQEELTKLKPENTSDVWVPISEGEILFSDRNGNTLNFENGHLNHTHNLDASAHFEKLQQYLREI